MISLTVIVSALLLSSNVPWLDEAEPDFWRVARVTEGKNLNMRKGPSTDFTVIGKIPHNATGLANQGCIPNFSISDWAWFSREESKHAISMRWCKVSYNNTDGWVHFKFLKKM